LDKPIEMFHIMEHFCLGKRRLQIFGRDSTIRPGWLTIGPDLSMSNYDQVPILPTSLHSQSYDHEVQRQRCKNLQRHE
jgi:hypothetical protein